MSSYGAHTGPLFPAIALYVRNVGLRYFGEVSVDVCLNMLNYPQNIDCNHIHALNITYLAPTGARPLSGKSYPG